MIRSVGASGSLVAWPMVERAPYPAHGVAVDIISFSTTNLALG